MDNFDKLNKKFDKLRSNIKILIKILLMLITNNNLKQNWTFEWGKPLCEEWRVLSSRNQKDTF